MGILKDPQAYYWKLDNNYSTGENTGAVIDSLCQIMGENEIEDNKNTVIFVPGSDNEKGHFELGNGGFEINAEHYEVIIGDGEGKAYGGSADANQKEYGSFFMQNRNSGSYYDSTKITHSLYAQGESVTSTDRYIFGNPLASNGFMPTGNFIMVEGGAFIKAKDSSRASFTGQSEIRIDHGALFTVDSAQVDISGGAKFHCQNGGELVCDNSAEAYFHGGHISVNPIDDSTSSGGGWSKVGKTGGPQIVFHDKAYVNVSRGGYLQISDNAHIHAEGSSLLKVDDNTKAYFEGDSTFMITDKAEAYFEGTSFFMVTDTAKAYFEDDSRFYMQNNGSNDASPYFCMNGSSAINMNSGSKYGPGIVMDTQKISFSTLCYNAKNQYFNLNCDYSPTSNTSYSVKTLIDKIKIGDKFIGSSSQTIQQGYTINPQHYNDFGNYMRGFSDLIGDYGLGVGSSSSPSYPWDDTLSRDAGSYSTAYGHRTFYHVLNGEFYGRYTYAADYLDVFSPVGKIIYMYKQSAFTDEIWNQLTPILTESELKSWYISSSRYNNLSNTLKEHFQYYAYIDELDDYETMREVLNEYANAYTEEWQEDNPGIDVPPALQEAMDAFRNITSEVEEDYFTAGNRAYIAETNTDPILMAIKWPTGKTLSNYVETYTFNNRPYIRRVTNRDFIDLRKTAYENKDFYFAEIDLDGNQAYTAKSPAAIDQIKLIYPNKVYYTLEGNTTSIIGGHSGYTWVRIGGDGNTQVNLLDNSRTENRQNSILSLRGSCQSDYIWQDYPYTPLINGSMATLYDNSRFIMRGHWEEDNTKIHTDPVSIVVNNHYNSLKDFYISNEWQLFLDALAQEDYEFIPTNLGTFECTEENSVITITFVNFRVKPVDVDFNMRSAKVQGSPMIEVIRNGELKLSDMIISGEVDPITGEEEIKFENTLTNESVSLTIAELTYLKSLVPPPM